MNSVGHRNETACRCSGWHRQYLNGSLLFRHLRPNSAYKRHPGCPLFPWVNCLWFRRTCSPSPDANTTLTQHAISRNPTTAGRNILNGRMADNYLVRTRLLLALGRGCSQAIWLIDCTFHLVSFSVFLVFLFRKMNALRSATWFNFNASSLFSRTVLRKRWESPMGCWSTNYVPIIIYVGFIWTCFHGQITPRRSSPI